MLDTLFHLFRTGRVTQRPLFPDLPEYSRGLPDLTDAACNDCGACASVCPTRAVSVAGGGVTLDLGRCLACGECVSNCPTLTIVANRSTRVAVRAREDLILHSPRRPASTVSPPSSSLFRRSFHIREVSTGDNASDLEVAASNNPIFDVSRFGVHFVASPRHADALLVTGPVGLAMQEPLRRCLLAVPSPRLVIAAGASAISGVPFNGGYASADGVDATLAAMPVEDGGSPPSADVYIPGHPPHPWYLIHGILLAMGHPAAHETRAEGARSR